jgi:hypothetical protein
VSPFSFYSVRYHFIYFYLSVAFFIDNNEVFYFKFIKILTTKICNVMKHIYNYRKSSLSGDKLD